MHLVGCPVGPVGSKQSLSLTDRILRACATASSTFLHYLCYWLQFCLHWFRHGRRLSPRKKPWANSRSAQKPILRHTNGPQPHCCLMGACGAFQICFLKSLNGPKQLFPLRARISSAASCLLTPPHPGHSEVQTSFYDRRRRSHALEAGRVELTRSLGGRCSGPSFIGPRRAAKNHGISARPQRLDRLCDADRP